MHIIVLESFYKSILKIRHSFSFILFNKKSKRTKAKPEKEIDLYIIIDQTGQILSDNFCLFGIPRCIVLSMVQ